MCGRFVQRYTWDDIQDLYELPDGPARNLQVHNNIAPTGPGRGREVRGQRRRGTPLDSMGLIPLGSGTTRITGRSIERFPIHVDEIVLVKSPPLGPLVKHLVEVLDYERLPLIYCGTQLFLALPLFF